MKLDRTFAQEIKKTANGDGSREARFAFLDQARDAARRLSTPNVRNDFNDVLREYGRATVGICVAVTIWERRNWLGKQEAQWAEEVLKLWTNRPCDDLCLFINDGLHPTRSEEYAGPVSQFTTEEE